MQSDDASQGAGDAPAGGSEPPREDDRPAARRPRRRRSRSGGRARGEGAANAEPEAAAFLDPPSIRPEADGDQAPDADGGEPRERKRRRRSRTRGGRGRRGGRRAEEAPAPRGDGEGGAEAGADAPRDGGDGQNGADERGGTSRRARRPARKRSRRGGRGRKAAAAGAPDAEPDIDVPPLPGQEPEAPDGEPAEEKGAGRNRKGGRARGEGRKKKTRTSRARSGEGRRSDGRRGERRGRDPRAVDIVPRAPAPGETPKEKVLLVNATDREEARIALLVDGVLEEVYIEMASSEKSSAGYIYRGRVQNVEPGIGAAFVDLGRGLTGFLHASDLPLGENDDPGAAVTERLAPGDEVIVQITRDSIGRKGPALTGRISFPGRYLVLMPHTGRSGISRRIPQGSERERVRKLLRKLEVPEGMGVIVRTASETTDAAALAADLGHLLTEWEFIRRKAAEPGQPGLLRGESDLAERSVRDIMPGDVTRIVVDKQETAGQIHRLLRVWYPSAAAAADEAAHAHVRTATAALETPLGELRARADAAPAAAEAEPDEPAAEDAVAAPEEAAGAGSEGGETPPPEAEADAEAPAAAEAGGPAEPEEEAGAEARAEAGEDEGPEEPEETPSERLARLDQLASGMPEVELHTDPIPLFHRYGAESQLEDAFRRTSRLPSGGSIVIDQTEALVAVDVNSGRLTGESDPETTALVTNLEAVVEAARQLRLRDLGGLIVIDFIDMRDGKSRRKVEAGLRDALSGDRARIRMGRMGPFGLVVLSRQRIRQALSRITHEACEACGGTGRRRLMAGLGLRVLREMEARVARSRGRGGLEVRAPKDVVAWIKKHRISVVRRLRKDSTGPIELTADARLAADGWAMKGLPPSGAEPEGDPEEG